MVSEIFAAGEGAVAVTLIPGGNGVFTVTIDGEMVFDKSVVGETPNLTQAKEIKAAVRNKLESKVAAAV